MSTLTPDANESIEHRTDCRAIKDCGGKRVKEEGSDGRPDGCSCWNPDGELSCWPCYREGFEEPNPEADDDR